MRRIFLLAVALLASTAAFGAISFPTSCSGTTSCTPTGTSAPGDAEFVFAYRAASATAPTNPAGWTSVTSASSATGASRSWRLGCRILQTTATYAVSGTFTNATNMGLVVVRGSGATSTANCATDFIHPLGTANSVSSATATYSALTTDATGDLPLLLMGSSTSGQSCTPTGATVIAGATTGDVLIAQANATGNWSSTTCSITSSVTTEIVVGIHAPVHIAAGTGPVVDKFNAWGTTPVLGVGFNVTSMDWHLHDAVLSNNLLACATRYTGTTITATWTVDGTTMTSANGTNPSTWNDGTNVYDIIYLAAATGKQNIHAVFSSTGAGSVSLKCWEAHGVATSTPLDVACGSTTSDTGPYESCSMTTTVDNDLILVSGYANGDNVGLNNINSYKLQPFDNWTKSGPPNMTVGTLGYSMVWGSHGAIKPGILAYQTTNDVWGVAGAAFKASAGAGTAPTGMYASYVTTTQPDLTSYVQELPCTGNLMVVTTPDNLISTPFIDTDGDSNTWSHFGGSAGDPMLLYSANYTCTNSNTRTVTIHRPSTVTSPVRMYGYVGAATSPVDTSVTTSTASATAVSGLVKLSGTQTAKAATNTTCSSDANANSVLNFTPSTSTGEAVEVQFTGTGPITCVSGTGSVQDNTWFSGENDSCCGFLDSSSGFAAVKYNSTSAFTLTNIWGNSAAAGPSGYVIYIVPFKAAAAAAASRRRAWVISSR